MTTKTVVVPESLRSQRKMREGVVVSDKMNKTRIVKVSWSSSHSQYGKVLRLSGRFYAHDEKNDAHVGDRVEIVETRPFSKLKRWRIARILEKGV